MASIITATTTSGLTQSADNSGVLQLASGTGNLVTVPSVTGTAMVSGNMPAFSAYASQNQSVTTATFTKVALDVEEFDTASCFNTSTYRFTPNVAGYYQISGSVQISVSSGYSTRGLASIYKNGSEFKRGGYQWPYTGGSTSTYQVFALIYLNGSTDYVELFGFNESANSPIFDGSSGSACYFSGSLVRTA
jgi:hypothetical protein